MTEQRMGMVSRGRPRQSEPESLVRAAIESTADGILVIDRSRNVRLYNRQFAEMWRLPESLLGVGFDQHLLEHVIEQVENPTEFLDRVQELYAQPELESYDQIRFKDGRRFERVSKPQRLEERIVGRVWTFRDVTQRMLAEAALRDAVRMRDEFLSIASHELYTPIHSLTLALQLMLPSPSESPLPPAEQQRLSELTMRQVDRLSKLVGSLLDVTRVDNGTLTLVPEQVDLGALVGDVADRFCADLLRSGSTLVRTLPSGVTGWWDRSRIEQVVTNLLANAIKFGLGKPIEISVRRIDEQARSCAILRVADHGVGIPPDKLTEVFERFVRAVPASHFGGLGLGLYVCRKIVDAHGGSLSANSRVGEGDTSTRFTMSLPIERGDHP